MGYLDWIRSKLREGHIHLFAPTFMLTNGIYLLQAGHLDTSTPGLIDYFIMFCTLFSVPYLLWFGVRVVSWRELQVVVASGFMIWMTSSFAMFVVASPAKLSQNPEMIYRSLPAGVEIYSLLIGVTGVTIMLTAPLLLRYMYRRLTGGGGEDGETTPEEKVLSDDELEEFDHPRKKLYDVLTEVSQLNSSSDSSITRLTYRTYAFATSIANSLSRRVGGSSISVICSSG